MYLLVLNLSNLNLTHVLMNFMQLRAFRHLDTCTQLTYLEKTIKKIK